MKKHKRKGWLIFSLFLAVLAEKMEQTVEASFLGKVKNYVGRVRNSAVSKIAVYSLAGVLGAGLGYGCEGDKTINPKNDALEIHETKISEVYQNDSKDAPKIYQTNPSYCEKDEDCDCRCLDAWSCDCHCYNKEAPRYESPEPIFECGAPFCIENTVLCLCEENTCLEKDVKEIYNNFSEEECQKVCTEKIGYWDGGCKWPEEAEQLELPILNLGPCLIPESEHCGNHGQCNCYCYSE